MKAPKRLASIVVAAAVIAGGCIAEGDRGMTENEQALADRLAESAADDVSEEETEAARREFMTGCMAESDLEYLGPNDADSLIEWLGLTPEEFRAQYGFGHSTTIDLLMAYHEYVETEAERQRASFNAMPEAERSAYSAAERECLAESYVEYGLPANGTVQLPDDSPINEMLAEASTMTEDDPRVEQVTADWSACMADQGYEFADRDEMGLPLQQEAEEFLAAYATAGQPLVDAGADWAELTAEDVLDPVQVAELETLQAREMATSAADLACIDQGHDIEAVNAEIYQEHLADLAGG